MRSLPRHPGRLRTSLLVLLFVSGWLVWTGPAAGEGSGQPGASAALAAGIEAYRAGHYEEALATFRPLAERGVPRAQTVLGIMYAFGEGVTQDRQEAAKWYRRAAEQGYPPAQYDLGLLYLEGGPVPRSERLAVEWLKKAALGGHRPASRRLRKIDGYAYAEVLEELRRRARADRPGANTEPEVQSKYRVSTLASLDLRPPPPDADSRVDTGAAKEAEAADRDPGPADAAPAESSRSGGSEPVLPGGPREEAALPTSLATVPQGPYAVQLVSSHSAADAERVWARYRGAYPELLGALDGTVSRADLGPAHGTWYRLRAGPLDTYQDAKALCAALAERDHAMRCLPVRTR